MAKHLYENYTMAEITLKYDARNSIAKRTIEFILSLGVFKKVEPNAIDLSLKEVREGKITKHKSVDDYFKKIV